jgi:hypothetical protein
MPRKCIEDGCDKCPCFNIEGEKSGIYCLQHKKDNMINVRTKRCKHNREKTKCKECHGSHICEHNREKSQCKECKGSQICEHNRYKTICKECRGSSICEHNKIKSRCKECHGSQICEHNREKTICKECRGGSICEHNKIKSKCKECKGSQFCEHNKRKEYCRECHGSQICKHNKDKSYCKSCSGSKLCKSLWCETKKSPKYQGYCLSCFVNLFPDKPNSKNYKTKEKATVDYVLERFSQFTWRTDKQIQYGCSRKRPDLLLDLGYQMIIIEIDENQHDSYDCSCENKRLMLLSQDVNHRSIVFIRFNPDDYLSNNEKVTSCWSLNKLGVCTVKKTKVKEWNERLEALNTQIAYWSHPDNKTEKTIEIIQLFYDCE